MECWSDQEGMHYEGMCIRPPSEANSILLQVTLGCSHNRCSFCGSYRDKKFRIKEQQTISSDIQFAARVMKRQDRLFLMDGDVLVIPQNRLEEVLTEIRDNLPWVKRVGTYANAKSIRLKTPEQLARLKALGLGIVYLGVESGHGDVLCEVGKGTNAEELVEMGRRIRESGMKLSVTVLLGIAGRERSLEHARATGALLTRMDPNYVGALTVMIVPGTPLAKEWEDGRFDVLDEMETLVELREMIRTTELTQGLFFANHASNYLPIRVRMPRGKDEALAVIDDALAGRIRLKPEWMRGL